MKLSLVWKTKQKKTEKFFTSPVILCKVVKSTYTNIPQPGHYIIYLYIHNYVHLFTYPSLYSINQFFKLLCTNLYLFSIHSYRVCEFLYEKRREYHKILLCYIKDPARRVSH